MFKRKLLVIILILIIVSLGQMRKGRAKGRRRNSVDRHSNKNFKGFQKESSKEQKPLDQIPTRVSKKTTIYDHSGQVEQSTYFLPQFLGVFFTLMFIIIKIFGIKELYHQAKKICFSNLFKSEIQKKRQDIICSAFEKYLENIKEKNEYMPNTNQQKNIQSLRKSKWRIDYCQNQQGLLFCAQNPQRATISSAYLGISKIAKIKMGTFSIQLEGIQKKRAFKCTGILIMFNDKMTILFEKSYQDVQQQNNSVVLLHQGELKGNKFTGEWRYQDFVKNEKRKGSWLLMKRQYY